MWYLGRIRLVIFVLHSILYKGNGLNEIKIHDNKLRNIKQEDVHIYWADLESCDFKG